MCVRACVCAQACRGANGPLCTYQKNTRPPAEPHRPIRKCPKGGSYVAKTGRHGRYDTRVRYQAACRAIGSCLGTLSRTRRPAPACAAVLWSRDAAWPRSLVRARPPEAIRARRSPRQAAPSAALDAHADDTRGDNTLCGSTSGEPPSGGCGPILWRLCAVLGWCDPKTK
jgi:hypothetical protein